MSDEQFYLEMSVQRALDELERMALASGECDKKTVDILSHKLRLTIQENFELVESLCKRNRQIARLAQVRIDLREKSAEVERSMSRGSMECSQYNRNGFKRGIDWANSTLAEALIEANLSSEI